MATTAKYLYYYVDTLFNIISLESIQSTQEVRDSSGMPLVDRYAIQDRDKEFFKRLLKTAAGRVFVALSSMSQDITDAYQWNTDVSSVIDTLPSGLGIIYIFDTPKNFDDNLLTVLDTYVEDALRYHVLMDWYKHKGLYDLSMQAKYDYENSIDDIKHVRLMSTKAPTRPYNLGVPQN